MKSRIALATALALALAGSCRAYADCPINVSIEKCGMEGSGNYCLAGWDWPDGVGAVGSLFWEERLVNRRRLAEHQIAETGRSYSVHFIADPQLVGIAECSH